MTFCDLNFVYFASWSKDLKKKKIKCCVSGGSRSWSLESVLASAVDDFLAHFSIIEHSGLRCILDIGFDVHQECVVKKKNFWYFVSLDLGYQSFWWRIISLHFMNTIYMLINSPSNNELSLQFKHFHQMLRIHPLVVQRQDLYAI